jgi:hypothetical protein
MLLLGDLLVAATWPQEQVRQEAASCAAYAYVGAAPCVLHLLGAEMCKATQGPGSGWQVFLCCWKQI